jgi:membrane protease YdiL (CAAX protease family)
MSAPVPKPPVPKPPVPLPPPRQAVVAGAVFYGLLAMLSLASLSWRDRGDAFADAAIGERGPWLGAGVGLAVGCCGALVVATIARRWAPLRVLDRAVRHTFAATGDIGALLFVLMAAIGEELFFRLAVQDAFGLAGSVAVYAIVNSSLGGLRWLPYLLVHATVLGLLVQQGFGLLGSTTANAIMNHLNLRRIQCR